MTRAVRPRNSHRCHQILQSGIRQSGAILTVLIALLTVCACDPLGKQWYKPASLSPAFGARVTDGKLHIWTGSPCLDTTEVYLVFDMGKPSAPALKLTTPGASSQTNSNPATVNIEPGVDFEYLTIGGPYPGFDIDRALPTNFDWRTAQTLYLSVSGPPTTWNVSTSLAEVVAGSDKHPADTYWFEGVGWLGPAEVASLDGKKFIAVCSPDPKS